VYFASVVKMSLLLLNNIRIWKNVQPCPVPPYFAQHTTNTTDEYPCHQRDSNLPLQKSISCNSHL